MRRASARARGAANLGVPQGMPCPLRRGRVVLDAASMKVGDPCFIVVGEGKAPLGRRWLAGWLGGEAGRIDIVGMEWRQGAKP